MDEEWASQALRAVFDHYALGPTGYGEKPMRCPIHDDAHASASVNGSKGVWHCHACGESGNAIHIVMAKESLDYKEAKKFTEDLVGGKPMQQKITTRGRKTGTRWVPPRLRSNS